MRHRIQPSQLRRRQERPGDITDEHYEVQKRDETGLVASVVFCTERQALAFADSLSRLMARTGERGSVQVVWPNPRTVG